MRVHGAFRRPAVLAATATVLAFPLITPPAQGDSTDRPSVRISDTSLDRKLPYLGVTDLEKMLESGRVTSVQLARAYLRRMAAYNGDRAHGVNAIIAKNRDALREAARLDRERRAGRVRGPLHGIPIVIKDNTDMAGMPTTSGSESLARFRPPDDAYQVRRLRASGAFVLAKTNLHEFAYGITTISSRGGQTRNPYDLTRNPGGSSGGTGAAVASAFAPIGMGTDTCGSIRIPAAQNSLVGLRPTIGLSSRDGVAPMSDTQDTMGPLGTSVPDVATVLNATVGYDPADPSTARGVGRHPRDYVGPLRHATLRGARIGLFTDLLGTKPAERPTTAVIHRAVRELRRAGATVVTVHRPDIIDTVNHADAIGLEFERDLNTYLTSPGNRAPRSLARLRAPRDEVTLADIVASGKVTPSVMKIIKPLVGSTGKHPREYRATLAAHAKLRHQLDRLLRHRRLDAITYPTLKRTAMKIGKDQLGSNCGPSARSGLPALTVPAGYTRAGMPVGLELLGRPFTEPTLLGLGQAYEQSTHHRRPPELHKP